MIARLVAYGSLLGLSLFLLWGVSVRLTPRVQHASQVDVWVGGPVIQTQELKEERLSAGYVLDIEYPEVKNIANLVQEKMLNESIQELIQAMILQFQVADREIVRFETDPPSHLEVRYQKHFFDENFVSFELRVVEKISGKSSKSLYTKTFNYSIKEGRELTLADIVKDLEGLRLAVSESFIEEEMKPLGQSLDGVSNFIVRKEGIELLFDPDQVIGLMEARRAFLSFEAHPQIFHRLLPEF